jgi:hypothetical protein
MTSTNERILKGLSLLTICMVMSLLTSFNTFAQGERDRLQDVAKASDNVNQYEFSDGTPYEQRNENANKSVQIAVPEIRVKEVNNNQRKENPLYSQGGEKDGKREGMSTLSFNLFLYIVDKFKED